MKKYNCKNCGAELYFDATTQKLHCKYCDSQFDPSEYDYDPTQAGEDETIPQVDDASNEPQGTTSTEPEPQAAPAGEQSTDGSDEDLVVYKCSNCGAEIITARGTASTTCLYCNRAVVLEGNISGEFKPDYVLPFIKTKEDVEAAYQDLCKKSILTPKLFKEQNVVQKIKGMYVPFWLHSMRAKSDIELSAKNIRIWTVGDVEYTEIKNYQIDESATADFDKIPTDALIKMDNDMMDGIYPFDYRELKPFNPAYLAGFYTERYDDQGPATKPRAQVRARETVHERMMQEVGIYTSVEVISENINYSDEKMEYGMLPVWMMYTQYKGKDYVFGMNGQTGKMIGDIPKDYGKAAMIAGGVFLGTQILMMLARLIGGLL